MKRRGSLANLAVVALACLSAAPLIWMLSVSFMPKGATATFPPPFWPAQPTLENYRTLLFPGWSSVSVPDYRIAPALLNSLILALLSTGFSLALTLPAGYAFAKLRFAGQQRLFRALVALVVVPAQVGMLPLFLLLRWLGLVNSYAGVLAPALAGVYAVLFVRQAMLAVPDEMLDAARIDGASEWQIFRQIVLPLLMPVTVTLALFAFLASWSDFFWPLIVLTDQGRYTLPVALAAISREHAQDTELMMAGAVITTLPVLAVFLALQRYYFSGVLSGSVKG